MGFNGKIWFYFLAANMILDIVFGYILKIPNTKHQITNKHQISMTKTYKCLCVFEFWILNIVRQRRISLWLRIYLGFGI